MLRILYKSLGGVWGCSVDELGHHKREDEV